MIKSLYLPLLLVVALAHHATSSRRKKDCAAVWVDDGKGHTVKAELPPDEARVLKKQMLDLLGLQEPPRRHRHHHYKTKGSAPQFLKSIYDALDDRGNAPHLDEEYREAVSVADTIITFVNKGPHVCLNSSSNRRLFFEVSKVPLELSLLGSELRLYRTANSYPYGPKEQFIVKVYYGAKEKSSEKLLASAPLPDEGWISLNLTSAMISWIVLPESNRGLRIAVTRPNEKHELHLHKVGISGAHDKDAFRPFMVGFFAKPLEAEEPIFLSRHIRSIDLKSGYSNPYLAAAASPMLSDSPSSDAQCQKRPLHVSFKDLGWEDWVIAPVGYNANFCEGRCRFPMLADMNATNHAIIQTLVKMKHAVSNDQLPPDASCAPKDLATISVLYYDYSNNVVLKKYPQMIVKSCACL